MFWTRCKTKTAWSELASPLYATPPPKGPATHEFSPNYPIIPLQKRVKFFTASSALTNSVKLKLLLGLMLVLSHVAVAQANEGDKKIADPSDSQNWSQNWSEGWKDRQKALNATKQWLTHRQLSEHTLLTFYGQVNVGQLDYDDGFEHYSAVRNNQNSTSRIGLTAETEFDNGRSLVLNFEAAVPKTEKNSAVGSNIDNGNDDQWDKSLLRKAEGRLSFPQVGFVSVGQGSMAADGITGFDFSGTTVVAANSVGDTISGIPVRLADGTKTNTDVSDFYPNYDASRRLRVRFDSLPSGGLSWAASVGREVLTAGDDNTYADIAVRYETKWRGFGVKGGLGYAYNGDSPGFLSGSVAGLDDSTGLNFAIATGGNTIGGKYIYGKVGIIRNIFRLGTTAFSADYYKSSSPLGGASGSRSWGVAIVQKLDAQSMEIYATYRDYSIDGAILQYADSKAILVGTRFSW
ncbi:hypothetical protein AB9F29_20570 [Falsihalocynthiibacter sp. S25ZX9]|uniref:hypothetical protein n=1 Tax=Falsihalocynthiibacter sp. S25ZX9 TaxID=3240870 RepID=UPI00350E9A3D